MWDEHQINQQYERILENEWERYNEEGGETEEDIDYYAEGEALWEIQDER